ncbi:MAG: glutamine synthetase family protein, partial [Kordiimonas sp.]
MPPVHFLLSDIYDLDNTPSDICARHFLKQTLEDLKSLTGLSLLVSFEHEFVLTDLMGSEPTAGFAYRKARAIEPFGGTLLAAMSQAGLEPETFLPEFSPHQFEVTCKPSDALKAADNAVILRELVRDVAVNLDHTASFSPQIEPDGLGSGVHIHFSFLTAEGKPATYDPDGPGGVSKVAGQFAAGIIKHLPAICAFTAPSVVSYQRVKPHSWSAAFTCFGQYNREAAVRICPVFDPDGTSTERQFNLEFRVADATANPYLALGTMIRAGLEGIKNSYSPPPIVNEDPADMPEEKAKELGIKRLPQSLNEALAAWQQDETAFDWFNKTLRRGYLDMKNAELAAFKDKTAEDVCRLYRSRY